MALTSDVSDHLEKNISRGFKTILKEDSTPKFRTNFAHFRKRQLNISANLDFRKTFFHANYNQGCTTPHDLSNTKLYLLRQSQRDTFHQEIRDLVTKGPVEKSSRLIQLSPFVSADEFIRAGGRLQKSDFDYCQKHPNILDGKHPMVKLFIRHIHVTNSHSHLQHTKALHQNEFWILSISNEIRKMLKRCRGCCRQQAADEFSQMSPLPEFRFPAEKPFPFQQTGLDLFGPFASKSSSTYNKRYALILTCLTTRAVHLEMCVDLSSDATMNALQRFFSR